jgi:hypothetical protein
MDGSSIERDQLLPIGHVPFAAVASPAAFNWLFSHIISSSLHGADGFKDAAALESGYRPR